MSLVKICPRCGEEYVLTVVTCVECGVALGTEAPTGDEAGPEELPDLASLVAVRHAEVSWIEGLAHALAEAGIPSRVELPGPDDVRRVQDQGMGALRCTLFVRPEDAEEAARVDATFARAQVPDLPDEVDAAWAESESCPGCGTSLPADASECPECGLAFASEG
jgi:hypothetical protein